MNPLNSDASCPPKKRNLSQLDYFRLNSTLVHIVAPRCFVRSSRLSPMARVRFQTLAERGRTHTPRGNAQTSLTLIIVTHMLPPLFCCTVTVELLRFATSHQEIDVYHYCIRVLSKTIGFSLFPPLFFNELFFSFP